MSNKLRKAQYFLTKKHRSEIKGTMQPRVPHWWEKEAKGRQPFIICKECHAVYFDEHWHTNRELYESIKGRQGTREELCKQCKWLKTHGKEFNYEGEVILENFRPEDKTEILHLVRNVGKRACLRDPEDQIIKIEDLGNRLRIRTTENQLAIGIGKQVSRSRKGGKLEIKYSHEDLLTRVIWRGE